MNQGVIAPGNQWIFDSLRGAPPRRPGIDDRDVGWLLVGIDYLCHCEERSDVAISCHSGAGVEAVSGDCHAPLGLAMTA